MTVLGKGGCLQFQRRQQAPVVLAASHLNTGTNSLNLGTTHLASGDPVQIGLDDGSEPQLCFVHRDAMDRLMLYSDRDSALIGTEAGRLATPVLSLLGRTVWPVFTQADAEVEAYVGEWDLQIDRSAIDFTEAISRFGDGIQAFVQGQGTLDFQLLPERLEASALAWFLNSLHQGCEGQARLFIQDRKRPDASLLQYQTTIKVVLPAIDTRQFPALISGSLRFIAITPIELKVDAGLKATEAA